MTTTAAPSGKRWLVAGTIMLATTLQAIDSTIAAVALPDMQGAFSASQDQISWVLTSYIVAGAIMTPMAGFLSDRLGRRRLYIITVATFVGASVLCGIATSIEEMVFYRLLQGLAGAPLVPLAQATMLDVFPPESRGNSMAIFGVGVMLGPIIGPSLGAWLTEYYNWRWVFFINLPLGLIALAGIRSSMPDGHRNTERPFDLQGFAYLSLAIGAMQLMLDRGNHKLWFQSTEIIIEAIVAVLCLYLFIAHILTARSHPFVTPSIFRDRNFSVGITFMFIAGINLLATMALLPPFLQNLLGYPVLTTGWVLAPRGFGTMISMVLAGVLVNRMDPRWLLFTGLAITAASMWQMSTFNTSVSFPALVWSGVFQGMGLGFLFVPVSTVAFATLPMHQRTEASGIFSLARNLGSSIGVSLLMGYLATRVQFNRATLNEHITPFAAGLNDPLVADMLDPSTVEGAARLAAMVTREAMMMAYIDDFRAMMVISLVALPLLFFLRPPPRTAPMANVRA